MKGALKAISPLIAIIIMMGVAVSIGVLISNWVTQWTAEQMETTSSSCSLNTNFVIDSAVFKNSTSILTLKITNKNSRSLYGFSVQVVNASDILVFNASDGNVTFSPNITSSSKLLRGRSIFVKVNLTGYPTMGSSLTEVKVFNEACNAVSTKTEEITQEV
ncbi:MAG: archaellin/type IV pilin N-terminal domain-containing protein [Nanoarchaeota archaeon]